MFKNFESIGVKGIGIFTVIGARTFCGSSPDDPRVLIHTKEEKEGKDFDTVSKVVGPLRTVYTPHRRNLPISGPRLWSHRTSYPRERGSTPCLSPLGGRDPLQWVGAETPRFPSLHVGLKTPEGPVDNRESVPRMGTGPPLLLR